MWNTKGEPATATFAFREGFRPVALRDALTGKPVALENRGDGVKLPNVSFSAWETRGYLSPRRQIGQAPADWFALQRDWWAGAANAGPPIPAFASRTCVDLTDDWAFKTLEGGAMGDPAENLALADPQLDDSSWRRMRIGIYNVPENADVHHAVFRKTFHVPMDWNHGRVCLFTHSDVLGKWRRYLDGKPLESRNGPDDDLGGRLKAGSTHCLAIELWGPELPAGTPTPIFLSYRPDPHGAAIPQGPLVLCGGPPCLRPHFIPAADGAAAGSVRTTVKIDASQSVRNVMIHLEAGVDAVILNGHWLAGFSNIYHHVDLNATPWVRFGQENEIIAVIHEKTTIPDAWLEFYDKDVYP